MAAAIARRQFEKYCLVSADLSLSEDSDVDGPGDEYGLRSPAAAAARHARGDAVYFSDDEEGAGGAYDSYCAWSETDGSASGSDDGDGGCVGGPTVAADGDGLVVRMAPLEPRRSPVKRKSDTDGARAAWEWGPWDDNGAPDADLLEVLRVPPRPKLALEKQPPRQAWGSDSSRRSVSARPQAQKQPKKAAGTTARALRPQSAPLARSRSAGPVPRPAPSVGKGSGASPRKTRTRTAKPAQSSAGGSPRKIRGVGARSKSESNLFVSRDAWDYRVGAGVKGGEFQAKPLPPRPFAVGPPARRGATKSTIDNRLSEYALKKLSKGKNSKR